MSLKKAYARLRHDTMHYASAATSEKSVKHLNRIPIQMKMGVPVVNIWSPSARGRAMSVIADGLRSSDDTLFVGIREVMTFNYPLGVTIILRRIVFMSRENETAALPIAGPDGSLLRNGAFGVVGDSVTDGILDVIMSGIRNMDYNASNVCRQRLDSSECTILSDKVYNSPSSREMWSVKFWHPVNKVLKYNDGESGIKTTSSHWADSNTRSNGNVYVLTFIEASKDVQELFVAFNTDVYWRERH